MMEKSSLSEALKLMRAYHDVSQSDLANDLGISRSYLSEVESGRKQPSLDLLKLYSTRFEVPLSAIMLFSETVESGAVAERVRKVSTVAALKFLNWVKDARERRAAVGKKVA
jgi:transcriptional regulator with XRE-family HTH domain